MERFLLLLGAGLLGGSMNAIAGGGSFVTFPALVFAGLPPSIANATNTVALLPGTIASSWAYRHGMTGVGGLSLRVLLPITLVGGLIGALLLLLTPPHIFDAVVPWLLLLATSVFAGGRELVQRVSGRVHIGKVPVLIAQFLIAIYGGYFGGAVGLMMMAVWSLFDSADLKSMAPARTLLTSAANGLAALCFAVAGTVRWPEMLAMMAGVVAGGYLGARAARFLPARILRVAVVALCAGTTVYFFRR